MRGDIVHDGGRRLPYLDGWRGLCILVVLAGLAVYVAFCAVSFTAPGYKHVRPLDVAAALEGFDAFPLFDGLGDAIMTGPTGNNVRDLRLLLAY